jgi:dolichol-phosphate mannosyltransferase
MPSLDIITSAYNEEECLPELFRRISDVMTGESNYQYRLIVIDNGSIDKTWEMIPFHFRISKQLLKIN